MIKVGQSTTRIYTVGKIVRYSWGYDQTNIDYYLIVKRSKCFVWLQAIGQKNRTTSGMYGDRGTCEPDPGKKLNEPILRRKVKTRDGVEIGVAVQSFGWGRLWEGKPDHWTSYA